MKHDWLSKILFYSLRISIFITLGIFTILIGFIFIKGMTYFSFDLFSWEYSSQNVSMMPAIINTFNMVVFALAIAVPIGVFGAVFLSEYAKKDSQIIRIVSLASETLMGIPSIVYGLFGYLMFVGYFGFGYSFLSGSLTLCIMILPLILRSSQEALYAVPLNLREASFALGAGKLRTIFAIVIPTAMPGILAGIILSIGKIVGESAALLYTSSTSPQVAGLLDSGRTLSVHMYVISSEGLHINEAYSTAMVLMVIVLGINICSKIIAQKLTKN
ncbi:phosphate ABC transporter, permease protein PstA [Helicobacter monodelphidis]|uniref:phosphate ABC transporter permease PstA n=1 Tax=Helicobacter sp. 15-1451 TaxID=2004995 RepID=UPI000DCE027C|nr:phosphate ABC transporter permease PstA [Helicobacter sp. 15-1451]RAX56523.1 phosphate ABC transporter, permease protein PstA [Helicobacter sp. 15-1451]